MKQATNVSAPVMETAEPSVHPLQKSYMFVSNRHVDYENLTAFEAVSMTSVFVLAVIVGSVYTNLLG